MSVFNSFKTNPIQFQEQEQSKGILDDYALRKHIDVISGTIEKTPVNNKDIVNKAYADSISGAGVTDHALLTNLDYASSSHTGFQAAGSYQISGQYYVSGAMVADSDKLDGNDSSYFAISGAYLLGQYAISGNVIYKAGGVFTGSISGADKLSASGAEIVNVCYGTGTAPTASTTTEGTIFLKYTA